MHELPTEILQKIFTFLHQQDKVECLTVCKKWEYIINSCCLFHTVRLCDQTSLHHLISKFHDDPQQGAQVQFLVVQVNSNGVWDLTELIDVLPNVKYLYTNSWTGIILDKKHQTRSYHHRIEHMTIQAGNYRISTHPLLANTIHHLKYLCLMGVDIFEKRVFDVLPKVTTLSTLIMYSCNIKITMNQMELLHKSLPLLQLLTFDTITLIHDQLPSSISPVPLLTKLHFTSISDAGVRARAVWLQYIGKKYPNLSRLEYDFVSETDSPNDQRRLSLVENGYASLFHGCGSQLQRLSLCSRILPTNVFSIMDNAGCHLVYLQLSLLSSSPLLEPIVSSRQCQTIQSLDLKFTTCTSSGWLKKMVALKSLILRNINYRQLFEFSDILNMCPDSLASLELFRVKLSTEIPPSPHSLTSLSFSNCSIDKGFDTFLSIHLVHLTSMKLIHCIIASTRLSLPKHDFEHFEMVDYYNTPYYRLAVNTHGDSKARVYTSWYKYRDVNARGYDCDMPSLYPSSKCRGSELTPPHFMLECASVKHVVI